MITDNGQDQLLKLVAGKVPRFADSFAVGISGATLTTSATALDFAWATVRITGTYLDLDQDQVIFYGTLDADLAGDVKEIGLISLNEDFIRTGLPNSIVYTFAPDEQWISDGVFSITNSSSIGGNNYRFDNAIATQFLSKLTETINISRYDTMKIKVNVLDISQIRLILKNDESNYLYKDLTLTDGENLLTYNLSTFTTVGTFDPRLITETRIVINTVDNATNFIEFDAITFVSQANGGLVARHVLANTIYKRPGATQEIEVAIAR